MDFDVFIHSKVVKVIFVIVGGLVARQSFKQFYNLISYLLIYFYEI